MTHYYTEEEVAGRIHRPKRWLLEWLRENPIDLKSGEPFFCQLGRSKRFTAEDIVRIFDLILTQEEAAREPAKEGYVYFLDGGEMIKIGFTRSLETRMKKMKTDVPSGVTFLHMEPGTFKSEKIVHRHFAELRVRGEWFRKSPELLDYIEQRKAIING